MLLGATSCATTHANGCPPAGFALQQLADAKWVVPDAQRPALLRALPACLADPDPTLRDRLAFEGLQTLLRGNAVAPEVLFALQDDLEARLAGPEGEGFARPFAALALAEVARVDRRSQALTPERRARLLDAALTYLTTVRDYRGFDASAGWRHGVAHGADLLMQLSLNPAFGRPELQRLRDAVGSQVAPSSHAYVFGEADRLALPLLLIAQRQVFDDEAWRAWLGALVGPKASWDGTFESLPKLTRRHNLTAFLSSLALSARLDDAVEDDGLGLAAEGALRTLP